MRVVLLRDIKGIGRRMEVKEVSDGYARNFLIPRKLAEPATEKAIAKKSDWEAHEEATMKAYADRAAKLGGERFAFAVKADGRGSVFGSVSKEDLRKALRAAGYHDAEPVLPRPVKTTGAHEIEVQFPRGIKGVAHVVVEPVKQ